MNLTLSKPIAQSSVSSCILVSATIASCGGCALNRPSHMLQRPECHLLCRPGNNTLPSPSALPRPAFWKKGLMKLMNGLMKLMCFVSS